MHTQATTSILALLLSTTFALPSSLQPRQVTYTEYANCIITGNVCVDVDSGVPAVTVQMTLPSTSCSPGKIIASNGGPFQENLEAGGLTQSYYITNPNIMEYGIEAALNSGQGGNPLNGGYFSFKYAGQDWDHLNVSPGSSYGLCPDGQNWVTDSPGFEVNCFYACS